MTQPVRSTRALGALLGLGLAAALFIHGADAKPLRLNVVADPAQMDPITYSEIVSGRIMRNMYEGFTDVSPDGKVLPALAESWEPLTGGPGFRFHLRRNATFHSGRPFTAKDVKYTMETLLIPANKGGLSTTYLANIVGADDVKSGKTTSLAGVKIVDDKTVEISFTKPEVLFPIFPIWYMDSGIVAEQGADWMTKVSAGTGPYKFKQWKRGVSVDLDPNPTYWGGAPKVTALNFMIVPNADTVITQYDAGELDVADVYEAGFRRVLRDERYKDQLTQIPRAQVRFMGMNQNLYAPFKNIKVREAVSLALDRPAMVRGLYGNAAFVAKSLVTPGVPGYTANTPDLKYDPVRAKQLMAEAGYPDGKGLPPVEIQSTEQFKDELTYYADQFSKVLGMPVTVKTVERATFIRSMNAGEVPFFSWAWTIDYPDANSYLESMWYGPSPYNRVRWQNAAYDKLIEEAKATADDAKRYSLYNQAEKVMLDDWGTAILPITAVMGLRKPNVKNVPLTAFGYFILKEANVE